jgi:hypothetical protein
MYAQGLIETARHGEDLEPESGAELAETLLHLYFCALAMLGAAALFLA